MYLSTPLFTLTYTSENSYVVSFEKSADRLRLFWEKDDGEGYQCFTTFGSIEDGEYLSREEIVEKANNIILSHKLESENTLADQFEHQIVDYPPCSS
jgi:hypothetical protein